MAINYKAKLDREQERLMPPKRVHKIASEYATNMIRDGFDLTLKMCNKSGKKNIQHLILAGNMYLSDIDGVVKQDYMKANHYYYLAYKQLSMKYFKKLKIKSQQYDDLLGFFNNFVGCIKELPLNKDINYDDIISNNKEWIKDIKNSIKLANVKLYLYYMNGTIYMKQGKRVKAINEFTVCSQIKLNKYIKFKGNGYYLTRLTQISAKEQILIIQNTFNILNNKYDNKSIQMSKNEYKEFKKIRHEYTKFRQSIPKCLLDDMPKGIPKTDSMVYKIDNNKYDEIFVMEYNDDLNDDNKATINIGLNKMCVFCKKYYQHKLKLCSQCKNVFYCSRKCQKKDWNHHKKKCFS